MTQAESAANRINSEATRRMLADTDWPTVPGIVESTRNIFCESIPDYQRVNVVWPESGHRMKAAAR